MAAQAALCSSTKLHFAKKKRAGGDFAGPLLETEILEGGPQMHLHAARWKLAGGFSKCTAGHIPCDSSQVCAIEKIKDLAFRFDPHSFREEEWDAEVLRKGQIEDHVAGTVISIASQGPFYSQSWSRERRGFEYAVEELALRLTAQMRAKRRYVWNIVVASVGVIVTTSITGDRAAGWTVIVYSSHGAAVANRLE